MASNDFKSGLITEDACPRKMFSLIHDCSYGKVWSKLYFHNFALN